MKKYFSTLMVVLMMVMSGNVLGSCGSSKDDADDPGVPDVNPQLDWKFTYDTSQTDDGVVIKWKAEEKTSGISETGEARVFCKHERDGYAGPREVSLEYSQNHTTYGKLKTVKTYSSVDKVAYLDSATTAAMVEDGNVIYCYYSQERVVRKLQGREYELPYIKVDKTLLEKLNLLPGTAKTREDGQVIVDSVCREPIWKAQCAVVNYKESKTFDVQVSDLFKVYQLEDSEIKSGKIVSDNRFVLDDNTERCDVVIDWTKNDNTVHQATVSKILNRKITTFTREFSVSEFGFTWQSDKELEVGYTSKVETDGDWTVYGRSDGFGAFFTNGKDDPIETKYELYHEKAEYKNEKFGLSHTFDFADFNPKEKSTVEGETKPYGEKLVYCPLDNTITTSYLGYALDASETVLLYKDKEEEEEVVTYDDWDYVASYETTLDEETVWHTVYLYVKGGKEERTVWDWYQGRNLEYLGPWESIEENNDWETFGVTTNLAATEPVEQERDGAVATWSKYTFDMQSVVNLHATKQFDKWRATEGGDFKVTYRGKTLKLKGFWYKVSNKANLTDNGIVGDYHQWGHSNMLEYGWGSNVKYSEATGKIKVPEEMPRDRFFPEEWGDLLEARQTVTNNEGHNGYAYVWSLRFDKGVLPVINAAGVTVPNFRFELFEYTSVKDYNSASYAGDAMWVNTTAKDTPAAMVWEREGSEYDKKDYREAGNQNWDEGHKRDGHASVFTSRYKLDVEDGYLTATDTYTDTFMGNWR